MSEKIVKSKNRKLKRKANKENKGRMKNFLMFLPNMVRLSGNLLVDNRVPITEKALFAAAVVYAISPIDFIPDIFPFIGQVDDLYLIALTLLRLFNYTDERVVRENWKGGGDVVALTASIATVAPMLLPQRVSRVLTNRVDIGDAGEIMNAIKTKKKKVLVATPGEEELKTNLESNMNN